MSTVLLVEDNPHIMKINAELLTMRGYEVLQAPSAVPAICWSKFKRRFRRYILNEEASAMQRARHCREEY